MGDGKLRWRLADEEAGGQQTLFDEPAGWHAGHGEFRGLEFLHVRAKRIVNEVPAASRMPFRYTINAYRGCSHACSYCQAGDTPILMADGRTKPLADVRPGDRVYGTVVDGGDRRYVTTEVLDHWSTVKRAYRVVLDDGTDVVASGDHRFLTTGGWKHVSGAEESRHRRPFLAAGDRILGTGGFAAGPRHDEEYRRGYLCGLAGGPAGPLRVGVAAAQGRVTHATGSVTRAGVEVAPCPMEWPGRPSPSWRKGFLAGVFDAGGGHDPGVLRIGRPAPAVLAHAASSLDALGFRFAAEPAPRRPEAPSLRLLGGLRERLRFLHTVDPATRDGGLEGLALEATTAVRVEAVEPLGLDLPLYDVTTGSGDFIANGVVSHNCFARPTHEYLGLDAGRDFERRIVVKINAVERTRAEVSSPAWAGEAIAMGTNTDPYQRCEGKYRLTRGIVEVLGEVRNPFSILTKSTLILRDLDVLTAAARRTDVRAALSIGTLDEEVWRATEPGTPHPLRRVEAVRRLNEAGIPTGVLVAPVLPGLSDAPGQLEAVTRACVDAGAVSVTPILLHLRPGVREEFLRWLGEARPDLVDAYRELYRRAYAPKAVQEERLAPARVTLRSRPPGRA